jgi:hypothetical protein
MRNPIRTLVGLVRPPRNRADGEPKSARKRAIATPTPGSREDLLLAAVREEFESFTQDVASEQARVHREFTDALDGLRALLTCVEEADVARVDELRDELQLTREGLVKSFAETRRRGGEYETSRRVIGDTWSRSGAVTSPWCARRSLRVSGSRLAWTPSPPGWKTAPRPSTAAPFERRHRTAKRRRSPSRNRRRDCRADCEAIAVFKPDSTRSKLAPRDSNASSRSTPTRTAPGGRP